MFRYGGVRQTFMAVGGAGGLGPAPPTQVLLLGSHCVPSAHPGEGRQQPVPPLETGPMYRIAALLLKGKSQALKHKLLLQSHRFTNC